MERYMDWTEHEWKAATVQRITVNDLQASWRTTAQDKNVWLLGRKTWRNEWWLKTSWTGRIVGIFFLVQSVCCNNIFACWFVPLKGHIRLCSAWSQQTEDWKIPSSCGTNAKIIMISLCEHDDICQPKTYSPLSSENKHALHARAKQELI